MQVRRDVDDIVSDLGALKSKGLKRLSMTTNGINLVKKMKTLQDSGVDSLNISLDTLVAPKFEFITRRY